MGKYLAILTAAAALTACGPPVDIPGVEDIDPPDVADDVLDETIGPAAEAR